MPRITPRELAEQYGGVLPPGNMLRPDDDEPPTPVTEPATTEPAEVKPAKQATPAKASKGKTPEGQTSRFGVLNAFVDYGIAAAELTPAEVAVWIVLFRDTKPDGTTRTGQADVARRAGLSDRTVKSAIKKLRTKGMVQVICRGRLNKGPSIYRVQPTPSMGQKTTP